tara:strand:+ start:2511 stop:3290 length:780 start_codon:yes stop_codon:yes gene_type:complete
MFFENLPNVYIGEGVRDDESFKYRLVKNIFRRVKVRQDIEKHISSFETYQLRDDETPSSVAHRVFGDVSFDWVILLSNNITDFYEQWPKKHTDLINYTNHKYDNPEFIHHYETKEVLWNDIVFIKAGVTVNDSWRTILPDGTTKTAAESRDPISNYEHEYYENEIKRGIKIPGTAMFTLITEEFENLVSYEPHSELDEFGNKKTPLNVAQRFLDVSGYVTGSISREDQIGVVTSYDYGPSATTSTAGVATVTTSQTVTV